jgi:ferrous iron transport protein B
MYLLFQAIFLLGTPLQDGLEQLFALLKTDVLTPAVAMLPTAIQGLILDGIYDGIGTVASFVPMIILFFLFMTVVEDSGYLSRAAFLMDLWMAKLGLDGRGFVMLLMGFGCNVPALMGTRVMQSRRLRLLSMLIIPFALCSARLQVFLFFTDILFSPTQAPLVLLSLYLFSFLAAFGTAYLFKQRFVNNEPFILEMPPYRLPTLRHVLSRGWLEVHHFLARASRFIILGVVMVWILTHFPSDVTPASADTWAGQLGQWLAPIFTPIGISAPLIIALMFGFVAKEVVLGALAVIYGLEGTELGSTIAGQVNWAQAYSFMLFTLLYTPCLSTIATLQQESKSLRFTLWSLCWSFVLAWAMCFVIYQVLSQFFISNTM